MFALACPALLTVFAHIAVRFLHLVSSHGPRVCSKALLKCVPSIATTSPEKTGLLFESMRQVLSILPLATTGVISQDTEQEVLTVTSTYQLTTSCVLQERIQCFHLHFPRHDVCFKGILLFIFLSADNRPSGKSPVGTVQEPPSKLPGQKTLHLIFVFSAEG